MLSASASRNPDNPDNPATLGKDRNSGRLNVGELAYIRPGAAHWRCHCECGGHTVVRGTKLRRGETVSCGCQRRDGELKRGLRLLMPGARRREIAAAAAAARWGKAK